MAGATKLPTKVRDLTTLLLTLMTVDRSEDPFEKLIAVSLMPAPNHNKIVFGVDPDCVRAVTDRRKAAGRR